MICSDEFAPLGRAESRTLGMGGIPIAVIPHPLAGNRPDEVKKKAAAVAEEVINIFALGIRQGLTAAQIKEPLYAYPTRSSDIQYMV